MKHTSEIIYGNYFQLFQKDAVATLLQYIIPAFFPKGTLFYEEGMYFKQDDSGRNLLEASPDGRLRICSPGATYNPNDDVIVEFKCPFKNDYKTNVYYDVPDYTILQILAQMFATGTKSALLLCWSPWSTTAFNLDFDQEIWNSLWEHLKDLYTDRNSITIPAGGFQNLKNEVQICIDDYKDQSNIQFVGEFPSSHLEFDVCRYTQEDIKQPFISVTKPPPKPRPVSTKEMDTSLAKIGFDANKLFEDSFDTLRQDGTEMLALVLSDSQRKTIGSLPANIPLAYGIKGSTLPMSTMRSILNEVQDKLEKNNTQILCQVFDGQFLPIILTDEEGIPTTIMQSRKIVWQHLLKTNTKKQLLNKIMQRAPATDPYNLSLQTPKWAQVLNKYSKFTSTKRKDVEEITSDDVRHLIEGSEKNSGKKNSKKKKIDLVPVSEVMDENTDQDSDNSNYLPDLEPPSQNKVHHPNVDSEPESINEYSSDEEQQEVHDKDENDDDDDNDDDNTQPRRLSFEEIAINQLQHKWDKWKKVPAKHLISKHLSKYETLHKLTVAELDVILSVMRHLLGKKIVPSSKKKDFKINAILECLGQVSEKVETNSKKETLKEQAWKVISKRTYPKEFLAIHLFVRLQDRIVEVMEENSGLDPEIDVACIHDKDDFIHKLCYFPMTNENSYLECRTTDPTHILTNIRSQVSRHGYTHIKTQAYLDVSDVSHDILPRSIVVDQVDRQNTDLAMRLFSERVEECLTSLGYTEEAKFTRILRRWFEACDSSGIESRQRLRQMQDMFEYLEEYFPIYESPPMSHYNGMPWQTLQMLRQNISCRIYLAAKFENQFNQRAISTLGIESFFSDVTAMEFSGLGCPKAVDLPRLMSHVVQLNSVKHNQQRGFHFETSLRKVYPVQYLDEDNTDRIPFDRKQVKKYKSRKGISGYRQVTRGTRTVRQFHKIEEEKVLAENREGVPRMYEPLVDPF